MVRIFSQALNSHYANKVGASLESPMQPTFGCRGIFAVERWWDGAFSPERAFFAPETQGGVPGRPSRLVRRVHIGVEQARGHLAIVEIVFQAIRAIERCKPYTHREIERRISIKRGVPVMKSAGRKSGKERRRKNAGVQFASSPSSPEDPGT